MKNGTNRVRIMLRVAALVLALCLWTTYAFAQTPRTIKYGVRGEDVVAVQQRLTQLGYYDETADGRFDSGLRDAVKVYQAANGLKTSGTLTVEQQKQMMGEGVVSAAQYDTFRPLKSGSRGNSVVLLQKRLAELGYYTGELDGRYGSSVKSAVKKFQTANGLKSSGSADTPTRQKMNAATAIGLAEYSLYCPLKYGDKGEAVRLLQTRLTQLGYYCGEINAKYDKATRTAVNEFQAANGLKANGAADHATRVLMNSAQAKEASAYYQTLSLKYGASSAAVCLLKQQLTALGYYNGTISASYDRATRTAVSTFQTANSIKSNGNADAATRQALLDPHAMTMAQYEQVRPLRSGDAGEGVRLVQQQLKTLGYYQGELNGQFSRSLRDAVETFQCANELDDSGKADVKTRALLNSGLGVTRAQYDVFCPLRSGNSGSAVTLMQNRLSQLGFYGWTVNGKYDSNTTAAVKAFQTANKLRATGTADTKTRSAMNAGTAVTRAVYDANRVIAKGESTTTVRFIKQRLNALGYYTAEINMSYDNALVSAVKRFQTAHALKETGKCDVETRRRMFSSDAITYDEYCAYCPIKYGEKSDTVRAVQRQLLNLGYYNGSIDGKFGAGLRTAVQLFEKANDLKVTSDISAEVRKLLNAGGARSLAKYYEVCALEKGNQGEPVRVLQRRLKALGFYKGEIDGNYGSGLLEAVRLFQKASGTSETGKADRATRELMNAGTAITFQQYQKQLENMEANTRADQIEKLIAVAESKLGCKYVLNAHGPDTFDCSNFTKYCFKQVGVSISARVIVQGYMTEYQKITDPSQLQRGDLLIFNTVKTDDDLSDHAGIYLGDNQFIHASSARGEVVITKFSSYGDFSWAFRLI